MQKMKNKYRITRWIFLLLSILTNTFLVLYSCLPAETTVKWNTAITNIFVGLVNKATEKKVETIPIDQLSISLSNDNYNIIPGYGDSQIPQGCSKEITSVALPENATDKAISYYVENDDIAILNQSGSKVSVVGMKTGTTIIHAKNQLSGLDASYEVEVVPTVAPTSYDVSVSNSSIAVGGQQTIEIDIDGGVLGHNELLNFRYYNTKQLTYSSSNEDVAVVNNHGVITPKSTGSSLITVRNGEYHKELDITVIGGIVPPEYANLHVEGSNACYGNDMISDQSSGANNYPLSIYDGITKLDSNDFIWESSNELLVKVDRHGVMRGYRKSVAADESAVITATSKITGQSATFNVTVKEELPTGLNHWIVNGNKTIWGAPKEYTTCVGDNLVLNTELTPRVSNKSINYTVSDDEVIKCTYQGSSLSLRIVKEGSCLVTISSIVNPNLTSTIKFTVLKAGSIRTDELDDVGYNIRKTIGHASLFAIAEIFTLIGLFMFLYDKNHWLPLAISLCIELGISCISEIVQCFVPGRFGSFADVCINLAGAIVGATFVVVVFVVVKAIQKKHQKES